MAKTDSTFPTVEQCLPDHNAALVLNLHNSHLTATNLLPKPNSTQTAENAAPTTSPQQDHPSTGLIHAHSQWMVYMDQWMPFPLCQTGHGLYSLQPAVAVGAGRCTLKLQNDVDVEGRLKLGPMAPLSSSALETRRTRAAFLRRIINDDYTAHQPTTKQLPPTFFYHPPALLECRAQSATATGVSSEASMYSKEISHGVVIKLIGYARPATETREQMRQHVVAGCQRLMPSTIFEVQPVGDDKSLPYAGGTCIITDLNVTISPQKDIPQFLAQYSLKEGGLTGCHIPLAQTAREWCTKCKVSSGFA